MKVFNETDISNSEIMCVWKLNHKAILRNYQVT